MKLLALVFLALAAVPALTAEPQPYDAATYQNCTLNEIRENMTEAQRQLMFAKCRIVAETAYIMLKDQGVTVLRGGR